MTTVEKLDLKPTEYIVLPYSELDKIVEEFYSTPYSSLDSEEQAVFNDSLIRYTLDDYIDLLEDLPNWAEDLDKWKRTAANRPAGTDDFFFKRDHLYSPNWKGLVTMLIRDGRIPQANYLLEVAW